MNNNEALAYIDRLWLKYGGLYANEKTAGNSEEAALMQKYVEREVLDKIREEIERQERWLMDTGYNACSVDIAFDAIKSVIAETENI